MVALATVGLITVLPSGPAGAASAYQLVSLDAQGQPQPDNTTAVAASGDGSIVAGAQAGSPCGPLWVRLRAASPPSTTTVAEHGRRPALSEAGTTVAYVECDTGKVTITPPSGAALVVPTASAAAPDIKGLALSPNAAFVAFLAGPAGAPATELWVGKADGSPATRVTTNAPPTALALGDSLLAFVAGGRPFSTNPASPTKVDPLPARGASQVTGISAAKNGLVAMADGDGVFVVPPGGTPIDVVGGADQPSVSPDAGSLAVRMTTGGGSIQSFTLGATPTSVGTFASVGTGGFQAPVATNGGRQVVFLASRAAAEGGSDETIQAYAVGPSLTTADVAYGDVGVGTSVTKAVTFTNAGTVAVTPATVQSSNPAEFVIAATGTTCLAGREIAVGDSCVVQVALTPAAAGSRTATVTVAQDGSSWDSVSAVSHLAANAVNGELSADPASIDFGPVNVGSTSSARSFTVTNSGALPTTIGTLLVSGGQAPEFPLAGGTCAGATLPPGGTCTVSVTFKPGGTGSRSASFDVGGSGGAAVSVALQGTGTNPPRPALAAAPTGLDFGELFVGQSSAPQTVTVRNTGNVANTPQARLSDSADYAIASNGCGRSITAGSSCTLTVTFNPAATGPHAATLTITGAGSSSATVHLSGTAKLNPALAATPGVVTDGQVLTVTGVNFPAGGDVTITWDLGTGAASVVADANGAFTTTAVVPRGIGGGPRTLSAVAAEDPTAATASVLVQSFGSTQAATSAAFSANSPARAAGP